MAVNGQKEEPEENASPDGQMRYLITTIKTSSTQLAVYLTHKRWQLTKVHESVSKPDFRQTMMMQYFSKLNKADYENKAWVGIALRMVDIYRIHVIAHEQVVTSGSVLENHL